MVVVGLMVGALLLFFANPTRFARRAAVLIVFALGLYALGGYVRAELHARGDVGARATH